MTQAAGGLERRDLKRFGARLARFTKRHHNSERGVMLIIACGFVGALISVLTSVTGSPPWLVLPLVIVASAVIRVGLDRWAQAHPRKCWCARCLARRWPPVESDGTLTDFEPILERVARHTGIASRRELRKARGRTAERWLVTCILDDPTPSGHVSLWTTTILDRMLLTRRSVISDPAGRFLVALGHHELGRDWDLARDNIVLTGPLPRTVADVAVHIDLPADEAVAVARAIMA